MFDVQSLIKLIESGRLTVYTPDGTSYQAYTHGSDPYFHVWFEPKLFGGGTLKDSSSYTHKVSKQEAKELWAAFTGTKKNPAYNVSNQITAMAEEQDKKLIKEL